MLLRHRTSALYRETDLPISPAYMLKPAIPAAGWAYFLRPPFDQTIITSTGILTCFPSTTLLSLALGTD
jgi:hypothetical protein